MLLPSKSNQDFVTGGGTFSQGNMALKAEIKERESELEDLGCWRAILLRRRRPTKKLTEVSTITIFLLKK